MRYVRTLGFLASSPDLPDNFSVLKLFAYAYVNVKREDSRQVKTLSEAVATDELFRVRMVRARHVMRKNQSGKDSRNLLQILV
jgi:hypothetical protein